MPVPAPEKNSSHHHTLRWENGQWHTLSQDAITPEWPLAIRLQSGPEGEILDLAVTMRTPGNDKALVLGFFLTEGIIQSAKDILQVKTTAKDQVTVTLDPTVDFRPENYQRFGYTNSSCGLCGKTDLEQLERTLYHYPIPGLPLVSPAVLTQLPQALTQQQQLFSKTGGIHAAALFNAQGQLLMLQEDVGRHNALDKLLGNSLLTGQFPWRNHLLLLSGRISYELVQKAATAGTPILAAIGAPSSLAIQLAEETGITLIGFLRSQRMNVYTYPERIEKSRA